MKIAVLSVITIILVGAAVVSVVMLLGERRPAAAPRQEEAAPPKLVIQERKEVKIVSSQEFLEWQKKLMDGTRMAQNAIKAGVGHEMAISLLELVVECPFEELANNARGEIAKLEEAKAKAEKK